MNHCWNRNIFFTISISNLFWFYVVSYREVMIVINSHCEILLQYIFDAERQYWLVAVVSEKLILNWNYFTRPNIPTNLVKCANENIPLIDRGIERGRVLLQYICMLWDNSLITSCRRAARLQGASSMSWTPLSITARSNYIKWGHSIMLP